MKKVVLFLGVISVIMMYSCAGRNECKEVDSVFDRMQENTESMNKISADGVISEDEIEAAKTAESGNITCAFELLALAMDSTKAATVETCLKDEKIVKIQDDASAAAEALQACTGYEKVSEDEADIDSVIDEEAGDEIAEEVEAVEEAEAAAEAAEGAEATTEEAPAAE